MLLCVQKSVDLELISGAQRADGFQYWNWKHVENLEELITITVSRSSAELEDCVFTDSERRFLYIQKESQPQAQGGIFASKSEINEGTGLLTDQEPERNECCCIVS